MITEDYVSFETVKLLKEKGFKGEGEHFYENNKIVHYINYWDRITPKQRYKAIEAPTLQTAMKWLREVYNFHIWVEPNHDKEGLYNAHVKVGWWSNNWGGVGYNTYEEACEAAIKYCLENLI